MVREEMGAGSIAQIALIASLWARFCGLESRIHAGHQISPVVVSRPGFCPLSTATPSLNRQAYCLFPVSVNLEVSNEVEVPPGVLIRALRAAPVGPCYTNYHIWFQFADPLVLQDNWIITIAPPICLSYAKVFSFSFVCSKGLDNLINRNARARGF